MYRTVITLLLLIPLMQSVYASDLAYPNKYRNMAESIFDMMDAFSSAYYERRGSDYDYNYRDRYAYPPYRPSSAIGRRLNGSWQGTSGNILVIRNGRFRLYRDRNRYREGRVILHNEYTLSLVDPRSQRSLRYEFAEQEGRLALRDNQGYLHLYKRVSF